MTGKWERSIFGAADLDAMVADGLVVEGAAWIPGNEEIPTPAADERVCFQTFFRAGLPFQSILLFGVYFMPTSCNSMT